jgi:hypothetical protein
MSISSDPRPGLRETKEPCLTVRAERNGGLSFNGDNHDAGAPDRVRRLMALLQWFPLPARHEQKTLRAARSERLGLGDVARHVWSLGVQEERPIERLYDWQLRRFLRKFGMMPRWFGRPPKFLASPQLLRVILAQSRLVRSLNPTGLDVQTVSARLTRLGLTREVVEKDVSFKSEQAPAFPVLVESRELTAAQQGDLEALAEALLPLKRKISLAEIEQVLIDRRKNDVGWLRGYTA